MGRVAAKVCRVFGVLQARPALSRHVASKQVIGKSRQKAYEIRAYRGGRPWGAARRGAPWGGGARRGAWGDGRSVDFTTSRSILQPAGRIYNQPVPGDREGLFYNWGTLCISLSFLMNLALGMLRSMCYLVTDWKKLVVKSVVFVVLLLGGLFCHPDLQNSPNSDQPQLPHIQDPHISPHLLPLWPTPV